MGLEGTEMMKFVKLMIVAGIGLSAAACQGDGYGQPQGAYQQAPAYYNNGYNSPPPPPRYAYAQPAPNPYYANQQYANQQANYGYNNQQRVATVTVTNRGQNGNPDQVVQQQVACGSQYYDGYRNRIAPRC
jgi:hypothetical protein